MIEIEALGSSSEGNAYRVSDGRTALLIEAGLPYRQLQQALHFRMTEIAGCLITHDHGDHSKATKDVMRAGVSIYTSEGTAEALGLSGHRVKVIEARKEFQIGSWTILPFEVEHDVDEPLGFLLANQDGDKLLFATDTYYIRYRFKGLTHIMVECNYSLEILNENIISGRTPSIMKSRLLRSHFSLENMKDFLRANDLRRVQEIWLLHLSDSNSDEELFKRKIQELTGKHVIVAQR
ncbi:MBL fold metallo-hydrolase [Paenibacillus agilis]|uniref:MBL fold metallo-hydrolase n=1 Tax=Paenibacillus agilis TaxID=3020863 RepID=A0A559IZI1_9BACL|nr:MBL fold metallo-hydrolase [Paenibacillus agilis]TVX93017.1 MBL fold metallo-hydrolase [Paenibacillus agilis]